MRRPAWRRASSSNKLSQGALEHETSDCGQELSRSLCVPSLVQLHCVLDARSVKVEEGEWKRDIHMWINHIHNDIMRDDNTLLPLFVLKAVTYQCLSLSELV